MSLVLRELSSCAPGLDRAEVLQEKVSKMLQKGVMEPVDQLSPGFYSRLFLVEKVTDGGWRPVVDLSTLNRFVTATKFRMETVVSVLGSIRQGDWMFSIVPEDVHFQIPVHPESRPNLCFCLGRRVFQFRALYFSLSMARRCLPESSLWFRSWGIGGACFYSIIWTIGWSLQNRGIFCYSIRTYFFNCARIWGSS